MVGCCDHCNELSGRIEYSEIVEQFSNYWVLNKGSAASSHLVSETDGTFSNHCVLKRCYGASSCEVPFSTSALNTPQTRDLCSVPCERKYLSHIFQTRRVSIIRH
jgi:hypothetical protein